MAKRHLFNTDAQPPLCGQRDRHGKSYLPARCCTTEPDRVTCAKCFQLQSDADEVARSVIETAKVEVEFIRATDGAESPFLKPASALPAGITGSTVHRIAG